MSRKIEVPPRSVFPDQLFDPKNTGAGETVARAIRDIHIPRALQSEGLGIVCKVVAVTNITLSALVPSTSFHGVTLAANDRVLVAGQSTGANNGVYRVTAGGLIRTRDGLYDGVRVVVSADTTYPNTVWTLTTSDPITVGTTSQTWRQTGSILWWAVGNTVHLNQRPTSSSGWGLLNVYSTVGDGVPVLIQNEDTGPAVDIIGSGAVGPGVRVSGSGVAYAFEADNTPVAFYATRNASGAADPMVTVHQQHSSNAADVVEIHTDGGGRILNIYNNSGSGVGAAALVEIDQQSATFAANALSVSTAATGLHHGVLGLATNSSNTGAGVYGSTNSTTSTAAGVFGASTANAAGVYADKNASAGHALHAVSRYSGNTSAAIYGEHQGGGEAAYFYRATNGGTHAVVLIESNDGSDDQPAAKILNAGTGYAIDAVNSSTGTTDSTIRARNNGSGAAIEAVSSATNAVAIDAQGITQTFSIKGAGNAPTGAAGPGAGTGPTIAVYGTDLGGRIDVTTGTAPAGSATVVTINFDVTQGNVPAAIHISPANPAAAALTAGAQVFANQPGATVGAWTLDVGATGLAATTAYQWSFSVIL